MCGFATECDVAFGHTAVCQKTLQWNLPYLDLYYLNTSVLWTVQINLVACSLLTILKFWLDESTRREPIGSCLPARWLVYCVVSRQTIKPPQYIHGPSPVL